MEGNRRGGQQKGSGVVTSPPERIKVQCPARGRRFEDWHRPSINLDLDDFDDAYLREASSATCPACGHVSDLGMLVVKDNVWTMS